MNWLKNEWEIATLVVMALAIAVWGIMSLLNRENEEGVGAGMRPMQADEDLVTEAGKTFLTPGETASLGSSSRPFSLPEAMRRPEEKPKPKPQPVQPKPKPKPQPVQPKPVEEPKPEPPRPTPVVVTPKAVVGTLYYAEPQTLADGTRVAIMKLTSTSEPQTLALAKGETMFGLSIVNITDKMVYLLDAKKRKISLKRSGEIKLWVFEE